jgi:mannose-6-phosphate isomerase-like protein (cupin superfamily)
MMASLPVSNAGGPNDSVTLDSAKPRLLLLPTIGSVADHGLLTVVEAGPASLPFEVARVYWIHEVPAGAVRGQHAHHRTAQVLVALAGTLTVETELPNGQKEQFELTSPTQGLYVPAHVWRTVRYSADARQLVLASAPYDPTDYIHDYAAFRAITAS